MVIVQAWQCIIVSRNSHSSVWDNTNLQKPPESAWRTAAHRYMTARLHDASNTLLLLPAQHTPSLTWYRMSGDFSITTHAPSSEEPAHPVTKSQDNRQQSSLGAQPGALGRSCAIVDPALDLVVRHGRARLQDGSRVVVGCNLRNGGPAALEHTRSCAAAKLPECQPKYQAVGKDDAHSRRVADSCDGADTVTKLSISAVVLLGSKALMWS